MKIGIIVHSKTGNTASVARKLKNALLSRGHEVGLEQVTPRDAKEQDIRKIQLKDKPELQGYDALIFGAPVWGFSLSPVMKLYLSQQESLRDKKVVCFVTQAFAYSWLGGNRAVGQMSKLCAEKGADIAETGVVNWAASRRDKKTAELIEKVGALF